MKNISLFVCLGLTVTICGAWLKDEPDRPERFYGKWFIVDWKEDGVTEPDYVAEADSSTYWLHPDGTFAYFRSWYKKSKDTTSIDGSWEFDEPKNQIVFFWSTPKRKDTEKWQVKSSDATTIVTGYGTYEITYQKAP